jgi:hypothetical protein
MAMRSLYARARHDGRRAAIGTLHQTAVRLLTIRCFCTASTTSSSVKFGCSVTRANRQVACFSIGETLPSVGIAATRRVSYQIAELEAISKRSAAFRRDAPASTTRPRKSLE